MTAVGEISAFALRDRLAAGSPLALLDVREPDERAYCAIAAPPGAAVVDLHCPMRQIPDRLDALRAAASGLPLVVYCHHGVRSLYAATWLAERGLSDVHNLDGGIEAWSVRVDRSVPRY